MSHEPPRYRVFNNRDQPVELHSGTQVVIVQARESVELDEETVSAPQIQGLRDQGFVSIEEQVAGTQGEQATQQPAKARRAERARPPSGAQKKTTKK